MPKSNAADPLVGLSAALANSAAPSSATTLASCAAWRWRSRESWLCASAASHRVALAMAALSDGQSAPDDAVANSNCPCPNSCCCCQRRDQSLPRLETAACSAEDSCGPWSVWLCQDPSACCRVMVSPINATATSNSQASHLRRVGCAARCWVMGVRACGSDVWPCWEYAAYVVLDSVLGAAFAAAQGKVVRLVDEWHLAKKNQCLAKLPPNRGHFYSYTKCI